MGGARGGVVWEWRCSNVEGGGGPLAAVAWVVKLKGVPIARKVEIRMIGIRF